MKVLACGGFYQGKPDVCGFMERRDSNSIADIAVLAALIIVKPSIHQLIGQAGWID